MPAPKRVCLHAFMRVLACMRAQVRVCVCAPVRLCACVRMCMNVAVLCATVAGLPVSGLRPRDSHAKQ